MHQEAKKDYLVFKVADRQGIYQEILVDKVDRELFLAHTWHIKNKGYVATNVRRNGVNWKDGWFTGKLHRMIMNAPKGQHVDHINHNVWDNRRSNLRICTPQENARNCKKKTPTRTGFKGCYPNRYGRFASAIRVNDKLIHLGTFDTALEAAQTYNGAAKLHFGEFASLNRI